MKIDRLYLFGFVLVGSMILGASVGAARLQPNGTSAAASAKAVAQGDDKDKDKDAKPDPALVAKGKELFGTYGCSDCHGQNGEGTDDAPNLTGTHLDAAGIAKFLNKPSADAQARGMPTVDADSPDLKPLVAFVVSLKKSN